MRKKSMTIEQCAARMTQFLAAKPKARTAAYVATLPKRDKIIVKPEDYISQAERDKARYAAWEARGCPPSPSAQPKKRKDRLRPSVRDPYYQSLIVRLIAAQGGKCFLCGGALDGDTSIPANSPLRASFDHVVPVSLGGENVGNRLAAHRQCNTRKGNRRPYACEKLFLSVANIYVDSIHGAAKVAA